MSDRKNNSLIAKGLHKKYGSRMVVNNVDILVNRNEVDRQALKILSRKKIEEIQDQVEFDHQELLYQDFQDH